MALSYDETQQLFEQMGCSLLRAANSARLLLHRGESAIFGNILR